MVANASPTHSVLRCHWISASSIEGSLLTTELVTAVDHCFNLAALGRDSSETTLFESDVC